MINHIKDLNLQFPVAIVGMGKTGQSVAHLLGIAEYTFDCYDQKTNDDVSLLDVNNARLFDDYATLIVSPGIDRRCAAFNHFKGKIINDVEIFAQLVRCPVIAVTGSNGKSTVVTMIANAIQGQGHTACLCGNIGLPVLDAWITDENRAQYFVLELSSYQLELCPSLVIDVGVVLNITPDHLNRYDDFSDYAAAKAQLVKQSKQVILNADDPESYGLRDLNINTHFFGDHTLNRLSDGSIYINDQPVLAIDTIQIHGRKNQENLLVCVLVLQMMGLDSSQSITALATFEGLPHRMKEIYRANDILWLDDSKATNIAATEAALIDVQRPTWLILGGVGKGQNFNLLAEVIQRSPIQAVLLIGIDNSSMIESFKDNKIEYINCETMARAVRYAKKHARPGDQVLLSPATASFDQYVSFEARGDDFINEVRYGEI